jgi:hypothetical protein
MFTALLPPNAIAIWFDERITAYSRPFFLQHWGMFAPAPPLASDQLQIRIRTGADDIEFSEWMDVTTALRKDAWYQPLGWKVFRLRTITGLAGAERNILLTRLNVKGYEPTDDELQTEREFERLQHMLVLQKWGTGVAQAVQMRTLISETPPFSEGAGGLTAKERKSLGLEVRKDKVEVFYYPWLRVREMDPR